MTNTNSASRQSTSPCPSDLSFDVRKKRLATLARHEPFDVVRAEVVQKRLPIRAGHRHTRPARKLHKSPAIAQRKILLTIGDRRRTRPLVMIRPPPSPRHIANHRARCSSRDDWRAGPIDRARNRREPHLLDQLIVQLAQKIDRPTLQRPRQLPGRPAVDCRDRSAPPALAAPNSRLPTRCPTSVGPAARSRSEQIATAPPSSTNRSAIASARPTFAQFCSAAPAGHRRDHQARPLPRLETTNARRHFCSQYSATARGSPATTSATLPPPPGTTSITIGTPSSQPASSIRRRAAACPPGRLQTRRRPKPADRLRIRKPREQTVENRRRRHHPATARSRSAARRRHRRSSG